MLFALFQRVAADYVFFDANPAFLSTLSNLGHNYFSRECRRFCFVVIILKENDPKQKNLHNKSSKSESKLHQSKFRELLC